MGGRSGTGVCGGNIEVEKIIAAHKQIRTIVDAYKNVNLEVSQITSRIKDNWVGQGRNEFESQFKLLIGKIDDFGDTLVEIYDALVDAEAAYTEADDSIRQQFAMSMEG